MDPVTRCGRVSHHYFIATIDEFFEMYCFVYDIYLYAKIMSVTNRDWNDEVHNTNIVPNKIYKNIKLLKSQNDNYNVFITGPV